MLAGFRMFQHIHSSVSILKMFIGKIVVMCCKRQAVWVLSFPRFKILKSSPESVSVMSAVEMPSVLGGKVSTLHVLGDYQVADLFQRECKAQSEISNFAVGTLLYLSLGDKYHFISLLYCCFCCRVSCVIPCRYFTLTAQINKSQTLIPRKKIPELQSRAKIKNSGFFSSMNRHWPLEKIMCD